MLKDKYPTFLSSLIAIGFYLSLAAGGIGLGEPVTLERALMSSILLALAALVLFLDRRVPKYFIAICFAVVVLCWIQLLRTENPLISLRKIDGFILASSFVLLFGKLAKKYDVKKFHVTLVKTACVFLALTVLYKFIFGFWQRDVRFFLNGPIVFGWLMGIMSLLSIYCGQRYNVKYSYIYAIFLALAMIWTGSKGPILGYFAGLIYLYAAQGKFLKLPILILTVLLVFYVLMLNDLLPERLLVFQRLIDGSLADYDSGSIGVRQLMWIDSWGTFIENPIVGVGLGNWQSASSLAAFIGDHLVYPHNIFAELLSEHGIIGATLFFALFLFVFFKSSPFGRSIFTFVFTSLLFTGDMGYWHFLVALPVAIDLTTRDKSEWT